MKFAGFTPDQQYTLLSKMGFTGPKDPKAMEQFLASTPAAASKLSDYTKKAEERVGKRAVAMAQGGMLDIFKPVNGTPAKPDPKDPTKPADPADPAKPAAPKPLTEPQKARVDSAVAKTPEQTTQALQTSLNNAQEKVAQLQKMAAEKPNDQAIIQALQKAQTELATAKSGYNTAGVQSGAETLGQIQNDPTKLIEKAGVVTTAITPDQLLSKTAGQANAKAPTAQTETVDSTALAKAPEKTATNTVDAEKVSDKVDGVLDEAQAATATASKAATVQGQLEGLMAQFEGGGTPVWASGAMRTAMAQMASRGLGASSIAGQAVVQAAMESAIAVASQDAQINAQFELKNLDNQQQTMIFKTQQKITSLLSDQAAENAAQQFNAASKNQTDQFFAGLQESVAKFNAEQVNGIRQFNAGQSNAMEQFNKAQQAAREQFNATNSLVVEQANAKWRQDIATAATAAQNEANMNAALAANNLTALGMNELWQKERDLMSYAFTSSENAKDRQNALLLAEMDLDAVNKQIDAADKAAKAEVITTIIGGVLGF